MISIIGVLTYDGISWHVGPADGSEVGVRLSFYFVSRFSKAKKREAMKAVRDYIEKKPLDWLIPGRKAWTVSCEHLQAAFETLKDQDWLKGKIQLEPEWEEEQRDALGSIDYEAWLFFELTPDSLEETLRMATTKTAPPAIAESLRLFVQEYPDSAKTCFIMMRFGTTTSHEDISATIKSVLAVRGITVLRADDRQYHDDLFSNILTYMHGCGFGIAVFDRLETDDFNPNVSLELGYMLALDKSVCLLKDRTQRTLHTDLMGRLYKIFDPQHPAQTIEPELNRWLNDKGL
jgi:hypothetical protein